MLTAGLDSAELISQLRAAHAEDSTRMGVDVVLGKAGDMSDLGIYECYRVSLHITLCLVQILRSNSHHSLLLYSGSMIAHC